MNKPIGALALLFALSCGALYGAELVDEKEVQAEAIETAFRVLHGLQIPFNEATANGHQLLFEAAKVGSREAIVLLLNAGAENKGLYAGQTALHMAVEQGLVDAVRLLLEAGVAVNMCDNSGRSPLFVAAKAANRVRNEAMMAALRKKRFRTTDPLLVEAASEQIEVVKLLLAAGADKSLADKHNRIPYTIACTSSFNELMSLLLPESHQFDISTCPFLVYSESVDDFHLGNS